MNAIPVYYYNKDKFLLVCDTYLPPIKDAMIRIDRLYRVKDVVRVLAESDHTCSEHIDVKLEEL